jgi:hypothetical protein
VANLHNIFSIEVSKLTHLLLERCHGYMCGFEADVRSDDQHSFIFKRKKLATAPIATKKTVYFSSTRKEIKREKSKERKLMG